MLCNGSDDDGTDLTGALQRWSKILSGIQQTRYISTTTRATTVTGTSSRLPGLGWGRGFQQYSETDVCTQEFTLLVAGSDRCLGNTLNPVFFRIPCISPVRTPLEFSEAQQWLNRPFSAGCLPDCHPVRLYPPGKRSQTLPDWPTKPTSDSVTVI